MTSPHTSTSESRLADRYRVLLDIARTLTGTLGTEELFRSIHQETARVLEASGFYISLYDEEEDVATVVFYVDQSREERVSVQYRGSESEVIRSGEASMVQDRSRIESLLVLGEDEGRTTRSAISAPLRFKGRVIGAISAQSYEVGGYCRDDLELLQGIADIAAVAIENARYVTEVERRRKEAEQIEEIGRAVVSSLESRSVLHKVTEAALELVGVDGSSVWLLEEGRRVRVAATDGEVQVPEGREWTLDTELYQFLVDDRAPVVIEDLAASELIPDDLGDVLEAGSGMAVPLVVNDEVVGALSVGSRRERAFSKGDVRVLSRLAGQASVALENARLHADVQELSLTDPLTGLANRRHLQVHMEREVAAARRGRSLAAVIFDLDHFKEINDTLGHVAGDRILERVGRILEDETRSMNLVARYGGDEFVSVLSDSDLEGARIHAGRVALRIRTDPELEVHDVTISVGVATFDPGMEGPDALIQAADEDLYREKDSRPPTERADGSG